MPSIKSPTILIHGRKDALIDQKHSIELHSQCKNCVSELLLPEKMSHNEFDFYKHLIRPLSKFMTKIGFLTQPSKRIQMVSPKEMFFVDQDFERYFRRERMNSYKYKREKAKQKRLNEEPNRTTTIFSKNIF